MEGTDLDLLLEDLETRVERLRSLYEQYFLGIEKIPPHVAQKDVDRRLYVLRREQIRNTARRFKLQTIIQRYNTFQQYWMRIMREIENGTYRRHVLRAERTVGVTALLTAAERKRQALPEPEPRATNPPREDTEASPTSVPPEPTLPPNSSTPTPIPSTISTKQTTPRAVRAEIERDLGLLLDEDLEGLDTSGLSEMGRELDDPLLSSMPPPIRRIPSAKPIARRSARPKGATSSPAKQGAPNAGVPSMAETRSASRSQRPSRTPGNPSPQKGPGGGLKLPASSAVAGRGLPPPLRPTAPRGAPMKTPSSPILAITGKEAPGSRQVAEPDPPSSAPLAERAKMLAKPESSAAAPKPPPRELAKPEIAQRSPPGTPKSPAAASTTDEAVTRAKSVRPPTLSEPLDRARVERLAEKLRAARQQTNESAPVSVDALAKKLQVTSEQLREKHKGKQVDFEVIIRDGKAILKPIVR